MRVKRFFTAAFMVVASVLAAQSGLGSTATAVDIPDYTNLGLPLCDHGGPSDTTSCYWNEPGSVDSPVVYFVKCDATNTNYCYDLELNGAPAPSTLRVRARMTAYKTHDPSVENAQYEAAFHVYYVPPGGTLHNEVYWGWSQRPTVQPAGQDGADLTDVVKSTDVLKLTVKLKMHKIPQFNVFVSSNGTMNFSLSGNDLTFTAEGNPATVAVENATQHINFDTEKNDDTTKTWTDRCGIPSMNFVVCNVDQAESNPLLFYVRSSTMVNPPAADVPGPIWVSTNATYFHFPSVQTTNGKKQIQIKAAAPHFLKDGKTVNSGPFRAFLPNGVLSQWGIEKTETSLNNALAASIKKAGVETVVDRSFTISDTGVTLTFPNLTYSSQEIFITSVSNLGGSQNANQVYATLLAGKTGTGSTGTTGGSTGSMTTPTAATTVTKSLKARSTTPLTRLIKPAAGIKPIWRATGACRIVSGNLAAITKGKTCTLTMRQTNPKTKVTATKSVKITVT